MRKDPLPFYSTPGKKQTSHPEKNMKKRPAEKEHRLIKQRLLNRVRILEDF